MSKDILIVDDEEDIRDLISGILEDEGFGTRLAWNYSSMMKEISKRVPSLILLDVWLENSELDGVEILKLLKKSYPNIPVIMISGHGSIQMAINSLKVGAFNFIEKPFDTNLLLVNINRAIDAIQPPRLERRPSEEITGGKKKRNKKRNKKRKTRKNKRK